MSNLFRRHSTVRCFFCLSPVPFPSNVRHFKCPSCSCWNRYDEKGEIISDEPAMHDEHLNSKAFAKRGSPSKDRLPNIYGPGPFCHSCQTNQMLLVNLLSNYLPEPDSPEYESRVEMLPVYRESLHRRYPPVCETCEPLVEDEIKRKEHMARVQALGGWLSKGKDRQRRVSAEPRPAGDSKTKTTVHRDVQFWWKVRGALWITSTCISLASNLGAAYGRYPFRRLSFLQPILPLLTLVSLLWAAWDPTYASVQKAQQQSREVRIHGKRVYNILQITTWLSRLLTSALVSLTWYQTSPHPTIYNLTRNPTFYFSAFLLELIAIIGSISTLRIHQPPAIRLVDTSVHNRFDRSRSSTPMPGPISASVSGSSSVGAGGRSRASTPSLAPDTGNDLLATLSLSSKPILPRPIFGQPSLHGSKPTSTPSTSEGTGEEEEMDWQPTNPSASGPFKPSSKKRGAEGDAWVIRPQQFFAPEKPTGLEGLLETFKLQDGPMAVDGPEYRSGGRSRGGGRRSVGHRLTNHLRSWAALYLLAFAILIGLGGRHYIVGRAYMTVPFTHHATEPSTLTSTTDVVDEPTSGTFTSTDWNEWDEPAVL